MEARNGLLEFCNSSEAGSDGESGNENRLL